MTFEGVDNVAIQRHHAPKGIEKVGNIAQASQRRSEAAVGDKAPQTNDGQSVEGVGRRARAILEQQELANLDGHPRRVDGLRLAARRVIRVPSSELQAVGIGVKGGSLHGAEPSRIPREERSGVKSSENDRLVWPSTARGKPRNCEQGTVFDLDTTPSDTSDSSRDNHDGNYTTGSTEADANNEVRENISQITQGPEVYVSHRWSRPAGEKLNKRAVQSRQVTKRCSVQCDW